MADNTDFFFKYNTSYKLLTLLLYDDFKSQGNEEIDTLVDNPFSKNFKIRYHSLEPEPSNTFDIVYKVYVYNEIQKTHPHTNMFYEFNNGLTINNLKQYLPNFVYTFGYNIRDKAYTHEDENRIQIDNMITSYKFVLSEEEIIKSCNPDMNKRFGLFTEYVSNSTRFQDIIRDQIFLEDLDYNLYTVLFQVYSTLYMLRNIFTHQDTNLGNILIKTLDKEINIIYNIDGVEYILKTKYIAVFIDYSNCHIREKSMEFINLACQTNCNIISPGCELSNLVYYSESTNFKDSKNFGRINKSIDLFLICNLMHDKDPETNSDYIPYTCELKQIFNRKFEYSIRTDQNPYGWISNSKRRRGNIAMMVKEYYPDNPRDPFIRYTSHVMTKFLFPLYGKAKYRKNIDLSLDQLKIHSDLSTNWEYIKSSIQDSPTSLAEIEASLRPGQSEAPVSLAEIEASLRPGQAKQQSFTPLTISRGSFDDNIATFREILRTIEIRPSRLDSSGGQIDGELYSAISLLSRIKEKPVLSETDIQTLHRLFNTLTDKGIILREGRQITKEQIYKIMNNLFNYSAAVSVPGRRGGYYDKYMKYKKKYIHLKNKLLFRNR